MNWGHFVRFPAVALARPSRRSRRAFWPLWIASRDSVSFLTQVSEPFLRACVGQALELAAAFECPFPVIEAKGGMCYNARVFIVDYHGEQTACKVFREGRRDRFEAERDALRALAGTSYAPEMLEVGENWVLMSVISGTSMRASPVTGLFPLDAVKEAFRAMAYLYDQGIEHLDFHPSNLKRDPQGGLKIHDFEGSYILPDPERGPVWQTPVFKGMASAKEFDMPLWCARWFRRAYPEGIYDRFWYERVGLTPLSLLMDPVPVQHAKRALFVAQRLPGRLRKVAGRVRRRLPFAGMLTTAWI